MAQWMGQYSGRTHESKVQELENSLSKAIEALRTSEISEVDKKQKSVLKLCERLLTARHKEIKARISKLSETRSFDDDPKKTQNLVEKEQKLLDGGVKAILVEFKIEDLFNV